MTSLSLETSYPKKVATRPKWPGDGLRETGRQKRQKALATDTTPFRAAAQKT
jgi:hypothetical protein